MPEMKSRSSDEGGIAVRLGLGELYIYEAFLFRSRCLHPLTGDGDLPWLVTLSNIRAAACRASEASDV